MGVNRMASYLKTGLIVSSVSSCFVLVHRLAPIADIGSFIYTVCDHHPGLCGQPSPSPSCPPILAPGQRC
jgi:hypothetical protein